MAAASHRPRIASQAGSSGADERDGAATASGFLSTDNTGTVTSFELFADSDADLGNGGLSSLGIYDPLPDALGAVGSIASAQVFTFGSTVSRYFHLEARDTQGGTVMIPGIGEVAFRQAVPEPAALVLMTAGLAGIGRSRRKRRG